MIKNLRDRLWLLLLCLVSIPGFAIDFEQEYDGVTITYTVLDEDARTVEVKTSFFYDFDDFDELEIVPSGDITIPSTVDYNGEAYTVVKVGENAFEGCLFLTSIELPESLTSIGDNAFEGCLFLTSIQLPESITSIGDKTFFNCTSLTSIHLPESLTSIGVHAFFCCTGLTSIELPESLTSIGVRAFQACSGLTSIELPESITYIGDYAFFGCSGLTSIELPESITSIEAGTFRVCTGLTSIQFPESLTSIGDYAFFGCTGLTSIQFPESLTSIGAGVFEECTGLTSIELPESLTSIGDSAFSNCTGLTSIQLSGSITSIGANTFLKCTGLTSIELPESLTSIGAGAFSGCTGLTSMRLPESIISIGADAFSYCSNLTSIELPESLTSIGDSAFYKCTGLTSIQLPELITSIGDYTFYECTGLTSIQLPESITYIGYYSFYNCTGLTSIQLPESLTSIVNYSFCGCTGLTSIQFPESITSIGKCSFENCINLKNITIPSSLKSIGSSAFNGTSLECIILNSPNNFTAFRKFGIKKVALLCDNSYIDTMFPESPHIFRFNQNGDVVIENGLLFNSDKSTILFAPLINGAYTLPPVETIADNAFEYCSGITELNIVNPLSYIGDNAFANCNSDLVINASISPAPMISESSFEGLYDSATLNVPEEIIGFYINPHSNWNLFKNLTVSPQYASAESFTSGGLSFRLIDGRYAEVVADESYNGLTSVTIPEEVTAPDSPDTRVPVTGIAPRAFANCESLERVIISEGITGIGDAAFMNCSSLVEISIPQSVDRIGSSTFIGTMITNLDLSSVVTIGNYAFDGVSTLSSIVFGNSTASIGGYAFRGTAISEVTLEPESELTIHAGAFMNNDVLATLTLGNGVVEIGDHAFNSCKKLTKLSVPATVKRIGKAAFYTQNGGINTLDLPKDGSLTEIADSAFAGIRVRELDLPDALTRIGDDAFASSRMISKITMPANRNLTIGRRAFSHGQRLAEVIFPETITAIGDSCFVDNILTTLDVKADNIGAQAFVDSKTLETLNVSGNGVMGEGAFRALPELVSADINIGTIGKEAFKDSPKLDTVNLGLELKAVNDRAFLNTAVTSLTFPTSEEPEPVIVIGNQIVRALDHLSLGNRVKEITDQSVPGNEMICEGTVDLGSSIEKIGKYSISGNITSRLTLPPSLTSFCENWISVDSIFIPASDKVLQFYENGFGYVLDYIHYSGHLPKCKFMYIDRPINSDYQIFNYDIDLVIGSNKSAGVELTNAMLGGEYGRVDHLYAGAALRRIERFCALTVTFDEGIETIDSLAVYELNVLRLPSSLKSLGKIRGLFHMENYGYSENSYPLEVILADSDNPLTITGEGFDKNRIESFYMGRDIESSTFSLSGSPKLENVIVGDKVTTINDNLFQNCKALKNAVMGVNVHNIGDYAFSGCTGLDILSIGESTETIGTNAYEGCTGFSRIVARAIVPPSGDVGFGREVEDNVPLFVPEESMDDYMNSDLFFAFANIESQTGKIVEEVTTDGEIDQEFTIGSQIKIPDWLKFIFRLVGHVTGHNSPAKAPARAEAETADPAIRWFAPNPNIASVDQDGVVTINGEGDIEIWAYALDGSDKKAVININRKTTLAGDVNGDGELSASDVNAIILHILLPDGNPVDINTADLSGDGQITVSDVNNLIERILNK